MLTALDVKSVEVNGVRRLGKPNKEKPRLLRASLPDPSKRQEVLRRAKLLKNSTFKNVFIQPDLTRMQQEIEPSLRKELKDRREQGDVMIYAGRVRPRLGLKGFHQ